LKGYSEPYRISAITAAVSQGIELRGVRDGATMREVG
jgi:hypothetical protein